MIDEFTLRNAEALKTLVDEHGVKLRSLPDDVLKALYGASQKVLEKQAASDPASAKIYESYRAFQQRIRPYTDIGEFAYLKNRALVRG